MDYSLALLFGTVQGITEFLPISSSGHLVVLHELVNLADVSALDFDVALHAGTLIAVFVVFGGDLWTMVTGSFTRTATRERTHQRTLLTAIIVGSIPAAVMGYFFDDVIEQMLRFPEVVAFMLVLVGALFLWVEKASPAQRDLTHLRVSDGFLIGLAQSLSLIPGTSRSGITILAGMVRKFRRDEAARFSFLLSVPVVFGAFVFKVVDVLQNDAAIDVPVFAIGILSSALVGIAAIRFLLQFLSRASLAVFAYYRFGLAAVIVIFLWLR